MTEETKNQINRIISNSNCDLSIIVKEINEDDRIYEYNSSKKLVSASLIKIPILLAILEKVKQGDISLNDTVLIREEEILEDTRVFEFGTRNYTLLELLNWMIITSDNTATNILIKKFGIKYINNYMEKELQLKETTMQRKMLDFNAIEKGCQNYTNQEDMLTIFTKLFHKEILTNDLCDISIKILSKQRCQDQVMRYIYEDVFYAHKTGSLDYLNHDVGVMKINNNLFYLGISIFNCKEKEGNKELVGKIGKLIFDDLKYNI